jgi:hypothetical protein
MIEYALWAAVRTMEDRVRILMTLADGRGEHGQSKVAESHKMKAKELKMHAQKIRRMLLEAGENA